MLRLLLVYGGTTVIISIAAVLRLNVAPVLIGKVMGFEAVSLYAIAAILTRYFSSAILSAVRVLRPRFAVLDGSGQDERFRKTLLRATTLCGALAFGGAATLILFGRGLIHLWVGVEFTEAAPVLWVLAGAFAFDLAQTPAVHVLYAVDRIRLLAAMYMGEAVANLGLSLLLVQYYGIIGVAVGMAIPCIAVRLLILPLLLRRAVPGVMAAYYLRVLIWAGVACGVVLVGAYTVLT